MTPNIQLSRFGQFFLERDMFRTELVEEIKTNLVCSITSSENRAVYEIMWKNTAQPDRPDDAHAG